MTAESSSATKEYTNICQQPFSAWHETRIGFWLFQLFKLHDSSVKSSNARLIDIYVLVFANSTNTYPDACHILTIYHSSIPETPIDNAALCRALSGLPHYEGRLLRNMGTVFRNTHLKSRIYIAALSLCCFLQAMSYGCAIAQSRIVR